jgi:NADH:ubiquinone oxidoreductase subunit D
MDLQVQILRAAGIDYDVRSATIFFLKILNLIFRENLGYLRSFCVRNAEVWESLSIFVKH